MLDVNFFDELRIGLATAYLRLFRGNGLVTRRWKRQHFTHARTPYLRLSDSESDDERPIRQRREKVWLPSNIPLR